MRWRENQIQSLEFSCKYYQAILPRSTCSISVQRWFKSKKRANRPVALLCVTQEREYYQRSRPPLLFPRSPPPPSRLSIGLASLTVRVRPPSSVPFNAWMAFCASPPELISTKPKPRD